MKSERENCGFEELMVAYIYDEATSAERHRFEGHLLDCSPCTDEFASLSNSRLSVFEWQKEDFAELETPRFAIPYETAVENVGWFTKIQELFAGFGMPVAAAASILVILGLGFAAFTFIGGPDKQVVANLNVEQPKLVDNRLPVAAPAEIAPTVTAPLASATNRDTVEDREIVPVKAMEVRRAKAARPSVAQTAERRPSSSKSRKAPALSNFEESDDKSLRLTDLFDGEIGGVY